MSVAVVLPALDEEASVADVVSAFRAHAGRVVVVDNGSRDRTAARAAAAGAEVVHQPRRGYGAACMAGIGHLRAAPPEVVVFADCDGTIDAAELPRLVAPILDGKADVALGRRTAVARGALPFKNRVARIAARSTFRLLFGLKLHDLGPFRAVRWSTLERMALAHPTYGFPVETVARAARLGARIVEVDTAYHRRSGGTSKVGTNVLQSLRVGLVMVLVPLRVRFARRPE